MKSVSSETVGNTSSGGSDGTSLSLPKKAKRARAGTNRGNLELDQPLDRIEPVMQPVRTRRGVYAPTQRTGIKRSFYLNTAFGLLMIAILVFGSIFGVIFAVIETNGALRAGGTPDYNSTTSDTVGTSTPFVATTLVPSSFSTLVPSSYSTLVPTEMTVYVQSEATTLVTSDATTLVQSLVTLTQRDAIASVKPANISPTGLVEKRGDVISTTGLTMSITTTVTIAVYITTFSHYDLQSEVVQNGDSQQTCGSGAQNACMSTANITSEVQSTFVTSTLSSASAILLDLNFTTATTAMPDSATITALTTTTIPDAGVDKVTVTYSMVCAVADVSSRLACSPVPTGWYISPSPPRATSFLHPVFRFISNCLFGIKDTDTYQFLRLSVTTAWEQCSKVSLKGWHVDGGGEFMDRILSFILPRDLHLEMWEHISQLGKGRMSAPPVIPHGA